MDRPPRRSISPRPYTQGPPPPMRGGGGYIDSDRPPARYYDDRGPPPPRDDRRERGFGGPHRDMDRRGPPGGPYDDPRGGYGPPPFDRRSRSPDDRRGKRLRSPSPPPRRFDSSRRGPHDDRGYRDHGRRGDGPSYREPLPPTSSRLDAPESLDYEVTFRYFSDYTRSVNALLAEDSAAMEAAYARYKTDFARRGVTSFFDKMKDASWFREKYDPGKEYEDMRERLKRRGREGQVQRFLDEFESGAYDHLTHELAPKGQKTNGEDVKTADAEMNGAAEGDGADKSNGLTDLPAASEDVTIAPNDKQLFIKTVAPNVSRRDLEELCDKSAGFDYLALSEPMQSKDWHRFGWVHYKSAEEAAEALKALDQATVNDFTLHVVAARDKPIVVRAKTGPTLLSTPERLRRELDAIRRVAMVFEKDEGDSRGSAVIEEAHAKALARLEEDKASRMDDEASDADIPLIKKTLDLYLHYLRTVFHCCYYCLVTCDFAEELERKCPAHLRWPARSDGTTIPPVEHTVVRALDERLPLMTERDELDPREFGGETYDEALSNACAPLLKEEDEGKYRCHECNKLFSARKFIDKHLLTKHSDKVMPALEKHKFFNNYVLDPARLPLSDKEEKLQQAASATVPGAFKSHSSDRIAGPPLHMRLDDRRESANRDNHKRRRASSPNGRRLPPPPPPDGASLDPRAARGASSYADLDNAPAGAQDIVLPY